MTHQEELEEVRKAIIKVVPDFREVRLCDCKHCASNAGYTHLLAPRPIRLTDVMRTVNNLLFIVDGNGNFYHLKMKLSDRFPTFDSGRGTQIWDLADDDLNNQSEATISFLHEILCKQ